jgi:putative FmdB family regulatory protein
MPIYEYKCSSCGHKKEVLQKMSDAPLTECPACGKPALTKLISAAGFQLKGSGWYATDFKGGAKPAKVAGKSGDEGKASGGDSSSGDTKAKDESKASESSKPSESSKAKEESKSDKPASAGASPAAQ